MIVVAYRSKAKDRLDSLIKKLDSHISTLDAKLLFIIHSHDPHKDIVYNYEKKLEQARNEIEFALELKHQLLELYDIEDEDEVNDRINDIMHC